MQNIFLDIPAGAFHRSPELQSWVEQGKATTGLLRCHGYDRIQLQAETTEELYDLIETVIFQESMHWVLQQARRDDCQFLEPDDYRSFRQIAQCRIEQVEPQLRMLIRQDMERLLPQADSLNASGYLQFSAGNLKQALRQLAEEAYHCMEDMLEEEEFVELLRFFIAVQPSLMEEAYLTIYRDSFTLTDVWGNDLRQIYLESLTEEEIASISENDLIMSILITLLPHTIYLCVQETPASGEFLLLLQRVFGEQLIWQKTEKR